jgi:hypothetical protein
MHILEIVAIVRNPQSTVSLASEGMEIFHILSNLLVVEAEAVYFPPALIVSTCHGQTGRRRTVKISDNFAFVHTCNTRAN